MTLQPTLPAYRLTRTDGTEYSRQAQHGNLRDVAWLAVLPGHRHTLNLAPQGDGAWVASVSARRRTGGTYAVGHPVRITPLGDVPAPQYGQVWRSPRGRQVMLYPCPHPDPVFIGALNLDTGRPDHTTRQVELLNCGYARVYALPAPKVQA